MQNVFFIVIASIVIGYGLGCINFSYITSCINGFDLRKFGSGNAGASNVIITMGRKAGIIVAILDVMKAFLAVKIAGMIFPQAIVGSNANYASCIAAASAIIGHIFPFYMHFRGGKGLATIGGSVLALDYRLFIVLLFLAIVIAIATDYICFVPISMAFIVPLSYGYVYKSWVAMLILFSSSVFVLYRHMENISRIKNGTELRFHFLWNRQSESERMGIPDDHEEVFKRERF